MNALNDPERPLPALTLTITTAGAATVQLTYEPDRPIEQTAVTLLDQLDGTRAWFFDDVVADAFVFLLHYVRARRRWSASASSGGRLRWQPFGGAALPLIASGKGLSRGVATASAPAGGSLSDTPRPPTGHLQR
jgi:hypothetical protein